MNILKYILLFLVLITIITATGIFFVSKTADKPNKSLEVRPTVTPLVQGTSGFSLEEAPSQSLRGVITNFSGDVWYLGRSATESTKLASNGIKVQQGEKYTTGSNSNLSIDFKNAVSVKLDQESEVDIIQTIPFNIVFSQSKGKAQYKTNGKYPITVRTSYLLTQINGEAVIERDPDKPIVTVFIKSGDATTAYNDLNYKSTVVNISEGQMFTFDYGTRKGVLE